MLGYTPQTRGRYPPRAETPLEQTPPGVVHAGRYGQQAGGMHPTGMQSCLSLGCEFKLVQRVHPPKVYRETVTLIEMSV